MDLAHCSRTFIFFIATVAFLLLPPLHPNLKLYYHVPFLIASYYQSGYFLCLWLSLACGLMVDFYSDLPFGINAFAYCSTSLVLFRLKRHFFADRSMTLPAMTYLFVMSATIWQGGALFFLGGKLVISGHLLVADVLMMPLFDALYAFICFTLPYRFFSKPRRRGADYFIDRN